MKRAAFALMSVVACTSPRAPHVDIVAQVPSTQAAVDVDAGAMTETCEAFRARVKTDMTTALAKFRPRYSGDAEAEAPHALVGFCSPSWRIDMPEWSSLETREDIAFAMESKPTIVHTDRAGHSARWIIPETTLSDYGVRESKAPILFDFDGDGDPELFLDVRESGDEGHEARQTIFLTFQGAIGPYAPADGLDVDALEDVDGDGRPDAKIFAGYTDSLDACFSGFPYDRPPSRFVAHSLKDGTFSKNDDVAKRYAAVWCPAPPSRIGDSAAAICARLWSKDAAAVTREMKRVSTSCVTGYCDREQKNQPQPPLSTADCGRRQQWFSREPPFAL